jgi:uncharacterized repeat protein (TIGR03803 family)
LAFAFTSTAAIATGKTQHGQNAASSTEKILHDFVVEPYGAEPSWPLIEDSAGNLFGVTSTGGVHTYGVVYEMVRGANGSWTQNTLYSFANSPDGDSPSGRLTLDSAGNVYGVTVWGGPKGQGVVFRLSPSAGGIWNESVICSFGAYPGDGTYPYAGLTFDSAGNLYGTTEQGGAFNNGTVFRLIPSAGGSWSEQILYSFNWEDPTGATPQQELIVDAAGNIFGTTTTGADENCDYYGFGGRGCGAVFELTPASNGTWIEATLHTFTGGQNNYTGPVGSLLTDSAGNLYGPAGQGVIYELQPTDQSKWNFTELFHGGGDIYGDLATDSAGNFYGEHYGGAIGDSVFELQHGANGWTLSSVYYFPVAGNARYPLGGVTVDSTSGNIFGVTFASGDAQASGTVFQLSRSSNGTWQESVIYEFPQIDGVAPLGNLITDSSGNLYGVASSPGPNGNSDSNQAYNCGAVFRLSPAANGGWQYDILYQFPVIQLLGQCQGGSGPTGLVPDSNGNLYGTTESGGSGVAFLGGGQDGIAYKLSPSATLPWTITTIYNFGSSYTDGILPLDKLIIDKAGNLYGTTTQGGTGLQCGNGCGTVFELSPQPDGTWTEKQLYLFTGGSDGGLPQAGLVLDDLGNLYGTTLSGGNIKCSNNGCGVVFKLTPNANGTRTESVIHSFNGSADGADPLSGLIFDSAGNLYGTASAGGTLNGGTVFELTPNGLGAWTESTLYNFQGGSNDGANPDSYLSFDSAGNLYGTTVSGGVLNCEYYFEYGCGALFKLTPGSGGEWSESIVHFFGGSISDGVQPLSGVLIDSSGNLFGATTGGPGNNSGGTVYEITQ